MQACRRHSELCTYSLANYCHVPYIQFCKAIKLSKLNWHHPVASYNYTALADSEVKDKLS